VRPEVLGQLKKSNDLIGLYDIYTNVQCKFGHDFSLKKLYEQLDVAVIVTIIEDIS
jgi:hypothetical protein